MVTGADGVLGVEVLYEIVGDHVLGQLVDVAETLQC
jgi:hypothetical protein